MAQKLIGLYQIQAGQEGVTDLETRLSNLDTEVSAIETGAGLNSDGTYTADENANYIDDATSLKNADSQLDTQIKTVADALGTHESDTSTHGVGEIVGTTETQTLTNKTIDVDNNTVSNIEVDNFKATAIVTEAEGLNSSDNDTSLPTTAAVKDYVDDEIAKLASGLMYKGTFDASAGNYTALDNASQGDFYKVSVAGTISGIDYAVGDMIIVNKDVTGTPVNADLDKIDNTEAADLVRIVGGELQNGGSAITVDADKNTISNLEVDNFKSGVIDTEISGTETDTTLPTSKAVKAYIDAQIALAIAQARTHTITNHTAVANASNVVITVPAYTLGAYNLMVFKNGVYLAPGTGEYTETSTTSITVASVKNNDLITIVN